jgi:hypothetical protein
MPTTRPGFIWSGTEWIAIGQEAVLAPVSYQATAPSSPATGDIWIDSDDEAPGITSSLNYRWRRIASGGETSLSGSDASGLPLAYNPGYEQLYINGVLQYRNSDYVATTGNTITGLTALVVNDTIEVLSFVTAPIGDAYTQAASDARYANMNTMPISGFRNAIINGGFSINQRNASSYSADGAYTFDRWQLTQGNITSPSVTRTANIAESGLPESIGWYASLSGTNNASTGYFYYGQSIEDVKTFAGQTVTVSFYAKGSVAGTIGTRMAQSFGTGGSSLIWLSSSQTTVGSSHSITTSWQRYSVQYTIPSVVGKTINDANSSLGFSFVRVLGSNYTPASNFGAASNFNYTGTLSVTGVQIEVGSVPTPVERRSFGAELSLCQRYYCKSYAQGVTPGSVTISGTAGGTVSSAYTVYIFCMNTTFPVTMRTTPVVSIWAPNGTANQVDIVGIGNINITAAERINDRCFANISLPSGSTGGFGTAFNWVANAEF